MDVVGPPREPTKSSSLEPHKPPYAIKKTDGLNPTEQATQFHEYIHGHSRQSQHLAMADTPFALNSRIASMASNIT